MKAGLISENLDFDKEFEDILLDIDECSPSPSIRISDKAQESKNSLVHNKGNVKLKDQATLRAPPESMKFEEVPLIEVSFDSNRSVQDKDEVVEECTFCITKFRKLKIDSNEETRRNKTLRKMMSVRQEFGFKKNSLMSSPDLLAMLTSRKFD